MLFDEFLDNDEIERNTCISYYHYSWYSISRTMRK